MTSASEQQTATRCPFEGAAYPFKRDREKPLDPAAELRFIRAEQPVVKVTLWNGEQAWLVTRYDDVLAVLNDSRFSSLPANPGYPTLSETISASRKADPTFLRMDPPKHTDHRRMWTPFFALVRIQDMRPGIEKIVDDALDALLVMEQPADFVENFALVVPSNVIGQLLDVPESAHAFFQKHTQTRMKMDSSPQKILEAMRALDKFWDATITEREKNPGDDLVSRLILSEIRTGRLSKQELVSMAQLMLFAGHETTANMIALGLVTLLQNPAQMERLRRDRSLMPSAVDEMLRYLTIAQHGLGRTAIADAEIGGQLIRAGEGVLVVIAAADRDAAAFDNPDEFDVSRRIKRHFAFGAGIHQCIGQSLARAELQIVFDKLLDRAPNLRVAIPFEDILYKYDSLFFGIHKLPVAW
jgi:cytochrome P450